MKTDTPKIKIIDGVEYRLVGPVPGNRWYAPTTAITTQRLADALVESGVIHAHAIEDKEGYDNYRTWDRVKMAADILSNTGIEFPERSGGKLQ